MDSIIRRYSKLILMVALLVEAQNSSTYKTLVEPLPVRTTSRMVKLYAGYKPEPINCSGEGFQADSKDCGIFYRCVKSENENFTVFKFQCAPGTVYDPETEVCNYPRNTKRHECGGLSNDIKEIDKVHQEIHSPIITKVPIHTEKTTTQQNLENVQDDTHKNHITSTTKEKKELIKTTLPTSSSYSLHQLSSSATRQPSPTTINQHTLDSSNIFHNKKPKLQNNLCKSDGFMGDYENCHKFYRCVRNQIGGFTKYEFSCSDSTVWDDDIQGCNHPWAVKRSRCGKSESIISSNNVSDLISQSTSSKNLHFFLDHHNSNKSQQQIQRNYISNMTQAQTPIAHQSGIQNQTQFYYGDRINKLNKKLGKQNQTQINYESAVNQIQNVINKNDVIQTHLQIDQSNQLSQIPSTTSDSTTKISSPTSFHNNKDKYLTHVNVENNNKCIHTGFMGNSNNCKIFYRCVDNGKGGYTKHEFSCGEGTLWDQKLEACNHAWAVKNCRSNQYLQETDFTISSSTTKSTQSYITSIQTTENHIATLEEINHNDEYIGFNNHDQNTLTTTSSYAPATTTTDSLQSTNNECKSSGFMGDTINCKIFYRCVDDGKGNYNKYEFMCSDGTIWNEEITACDHESSNNKCVISSKEYLNYTNEHQLILEGVYSSTNTIRQEEHNTQGTTWIQDIQSCDHYNGVTNCSLQNESIYKQPDDSQHSSTSIAITLANSILPSKGNNTTQELRNNDCTSEGFHSDKKNCKKFYRCVDNGNGGLTKYEFTCGEGTAWDEDIKGCNHMDLVESCQSSSSTSEIITDAVVYTSTMAAATIAQKDNSTDSNENTSTNCKDNCNKEGYFGNVSDCKKFYRCVNDGKDGFIKYDFTCGDGTIWDQDISACNHPQDVINPSCLENSTTDCSTSTNTTTIPTLTESSTSTTQHGEQLLTTTQGETSKQPVNNNFTCNQAGYFPNPNDCKKFYRCVDNGNGGLTKYEFTCGEGTAWDEDIKGCNHMDLVESCQSSSSTSEIITDAVVYTSTMAAATIAQKDNSTDSNENTSTNCKDNCNEEGYFGNVSDCKKFYRCVNDGKDGFIKYDFTCGDGTIWDQDISACNHPQDVINPSCLENSTTDCSTSTNTTIIPTLTESSTSTTQHGEQLLTTTQGETSKQPVNNNFTCNQAGYFPNPNDCKKFYRCVDWHGDGNKFSIFHFECGDGTIWDPELDTCNHEESIYPPRDCSGTQSQTENSEHVTSTNEATTAQEITTQQTTTSNTQTTMQITTQQITTSEHTTTHQTTTKQSTTTDKTTTQETTTSIQSTSENITVSQQPTTTTSQITTNNGQSTITEKTTPQQTVTTEKETTTKEPTTTTQISMESTNIENTTTQKATTEQNTQQTPDNQLTTTEQATTIESSTTDGSILTTTQSSSETSTDKGDQEITTENTTTSIQMCPETDDDQYLFVCPTSFRRHPKYCNLFYQCTEEDDSHDAKIAVFTCPNNTIYDESKIKCVEEDKAEKTCDGEIASHRRVKRLGFRYKEPIVVADIYSCTTIGYVPFENNSECSPAFLKCEKSKSGKLRGYVYQCPQNYIYWSISRKCERTENVRDCKRTTNNWSNRWELPIEKHNVAW